MRRSAPTSTLSPIQTLLIVLATAMLTGCGSGGLDLARTDTPTSAPATSTAAASSDPVAAALQSAPPATEVPRTASGLQKVVITMRGAVGKDANPQVAYEMLQAAKSSVQLKGGHVTQDLPFIGAIAAEVSDSGVAELMQDPRVAMIEPDLPVQCEAAEIDANWGVARVGAPAVFALGNRGEGVRVAIIDTGVDYTHPDLRDAYAGGYDFYSGDTDPKDEYWHGTHVAGIVAARANNAGTMGVAPECRLYALKVCGADGGGSFSAIVAAMQWCVTNKIQVANVSLGATSHPGQYVENAFNAAQAAGVVVVAAAGNSGRSDASGNTVTYPGAFSSCICVGAVDGSNNRVSFSGTGPRVDVAAPGVGIYSTLPNGDYGSLSGTSMASPHVAGVAALAIRRGYTAAQIRDRMLATALDLGTAGRDPQYGAGLVQANRIVDTANTPPSVTITAPAAGASFPRGSTVTLTAQATDVEDGVITSRIIWNVNGQTYANPSVRLRLADGAYTATATVTDVTGASASAAVQFTVHNQTPTVAITAPKGGASVRWSANMLCTATASDAEDGNLANRITWFIDGRRIGAGARFTYRIPRTLTPGAHTLSAQVTDTGGATSAPATVSITVTR